MHILFFTSIIPSILCLLQYNALVLPLILKDGCVLQLGKRQQLLLTLTIPSNLCLAQNSGSVKDG
jgi:hypothetical protein